MKRVIKFRGKRIENGEWVFGDLKHRECVPKSISPIQIGECAVVSETIGQFTGLLDKNGKEIYEGDIVQCNKDICKLVYSDHYAGFALDKQGWAYLHFFGEAFSTEDCMVIGTIHDNPELLKGGKEESTKKHNPHRP